MSLKLSPRVVVEEGAKLADEVGLERLTLAALAKRLQVAVPSLYNHIRSLESLLAEIALLATRELSERMGRAAMGKARLEALSSVASAYRAYALDHPGRYAATVRAAAEGDVLGEERRAAAAQTAHVVFAILEGYGIAGVDLVDATRLLRSALHGFAAIEASGGFGMAREVERSFDVMIHHLDGMLQGWRAR